ncbi:hypothetical protein [Gimesia alba]|uniref:hypothetical protein n=1 Tax=Gimesia alba TaxID=2527973 RepID=UPI0011A04B0B|nr:hypothetical protein [Gimesia alba]
MRVRVPFRLPEPANRRFTKCLNSITPENRTKADVLRSALGDGLFLNRLRLRPETLPEAARGDALQFVDTVFVLPKWKHIETMLHFRMESCGRPGRSATA